MTGLRRALAGLAIAGFVLGCLTFTVVITSDHWPDRELEAVVALVGGWAFIATGLLAWLRRPDNRFGALMVAVGIALLVARLHASDLPLLFTIGGLASPLYLAVYAHLLVAFPSGRLEGRWPRVLVVTAYASALVLGGARMLVNDHRSAGAQLFGDCDCPRNLLLVDPNEALATALYGAQNGVALAVALGSLAVVARCWRNATPPARRSFAPILASGVVTIALWVLLFVTRLADVGQSTPAVIRLGAFVAFAGLPFAFLLGLVRSRFFRAAALTDLVERLRDARQPGRLRDALAEALGDPSVEIAYWMPDSGRYVDADGRPVELPADGSARAWTGVERDGRPVAAILHDASLRDEPQLVRATGAAAALALDRERLDAELRARLEDLRASRARLVEASDAERRRIERDLHDGAQGRLVSLLLNLKLARRDTVGERGSDEALLDEVEGELTAALGELRALAGGILPPVLSGHGLVAAIEELASRSPVEVVLEEVPAERLPDRVEVAAYFVVAEALTNTAKHARASRASVRVARVDGRVSIEVRDDGVGGAGAAEGSGLRGLADRVGALDGRLHVHSPAGQGTTVRAEVPCAS